MPTADHGETVTLKRFCQVHIECMLIMLVRELQSPYSSEAHQKYDALQTNESHILCIQNMGICLSRMHLSGLN